MRLNGKVILVTGASKGIGQAIAQGVAREGADVIVNYHMDKEGALHTVERIEEQGSKALPVQADISDLKQIDTLFEQIEEHFGRLDVLINNAAITGWTSVFDVTEKQWDRIINTNLKGAFFCSIHAARIMREHGGGRIVNVSTNCAGLGVKNLAVYAISKGGIHAMTKQLAVELAPHNIRVNTFAPGPTATARNLKQDPNYDKTWGQQVPLDRVADREEMVGPAVFLASDESSYMTGQLFYVDGGWSVFGHVPTDQMDQALSDAEASLRKENP